MLIILLILSPILLVTAICFLALWHKAERARIKGPLYENAICHLGFTIGISHPRHIEQVISALDSRYPQYEVVVVADLGHSPLQDIVRRYHLVRVNASRLLEHSDARGLYRSHRRAHQQVVVIDAPQQGKTSPNEAIRRVASYPYVVTLANGAMLCNDSITYIANTIASYPLNEGVCLRSIVGAGVSVQPLYPSYREKLVVSSRILAYLHSRRAPLLCATAALVAPLVPVAVSAVAKEELALIPSAIVVAIGLIGIYLAHRIMFQNGLFVTFGVVTINFCRFLVEDMRKFCYLYKRCEGEAPHNEFGSLIYKRREKQYDYDKTDKGVSPSARLQRRTASRRRDYGCVRK